MNPSRRFVSTWSSRTRLRPLHRHRLSPPTWRMLLATVFLAEGHDVGYANKRAGYCEARYKAENGKYLTVVGAGGKPIRYPTPEAAKAAADRAELEHQVRAQ